MGRKRKSFFKKLTDAISLRGDGDEYYPNDYYEDVDVMKDEDTEDIPARSDDLTKKIKIKKEDDENIAPSAMELPVDVYNTNDTIYIVAVVGGAKKTDIDLYVTRESVSIIGKRNPHPSFSRGDSIISELYWGDFERHVVLPDEIDVDLAEAKEEVGLLVIKLPKFNKFKKNKVRIN